MTDVSLTARTEAIELRLAIIEVLDNFDALASKELILLRFNHACEDCNEERNGCLRSESQ
eukprot:scaffold94779_cov71-Cyclotella_meneghiniana.AAC.1